MDSYGVHRSNFEHIDGIAGERLYWKRMAVDIFCDAGHIGIILRAQSCTRCFERVSTKAVRRRIPPALIERI